jgi:isopenicillin N synthase-like dioxygenase
MSPTISLTLAAETAELGSAFQEVPIIDLRPDATSDEDRLAIAEQIRDACLRVGFFYVKNHRIPDSTISRVFEETKRFFSLPLEEKMKIDVHKSSNFKGYNALLSENNNPENDGDLHEGLNIGWEPPEGSSEGQDYGSDVAMTGANVWPDDLPGFRPNVMEYYHAAVRLGKSLFPLFALALGLPSTYFDDKTRKSAAIMRLLHYPPQTGTVDDRIVGIGAHTDFECFTILWQQDGIPALQALNADNKWVDVAPIPGTLVINLGDQLARWTNDVFKSTKHRAVNRSGTRRYSIPLFFGTDYDVELVPMLTCVSPERPPKYEPVLAGEYVKSRLEAAYGNSKKDR